MKEISAGIMVYRTKGNTLEVLLGKNGGPRWASREVGAWNIPKGHVEEDEELIEGAIREFKEETSLEIPNNYKETLKYLGVNRTNTGKYVHIFAFEYDYNPSGYEVHITSNMCDTEWPPKSGKIIQVPELCKAYYWKKDVAERMIFPYQKSFIKKLFDILKEEHQI